MRRARRRERLVLLERAMLLPARPGWRQVRPVRAEPLPRGRERHVHMYEWIAPMQIYGLKSIQNSTSFMLASLLFSVR